MTIELAIISRLNEPEIADYFTRNPHRMAAFRVLLDLLSIQLPGWAKRGISGRAATRRNIMAAFRADYPDPPNYTAAPRKPNATPERIAEIKAKKQSLITNTIRIINDV
jgi:hypothetical protein